MDNLEFIKNPILLGIITSVLVYLYMYWNEEQKRKKNPQLPHKSVNIMIPGIIGAMVWFMSSSYFDGKIINNDNNKVGMIPLNTEIHKLDENVEILSKESDGSFGSKSYKLVGKGIVTLPNESIFISLADF